jgi:hypothetical protein
MNDGLIFAVVFVILLAFIGGLTNVRHRHRVRRRSR